MVDEQGAREHARIAFDAAPTTITGPSAWRGADLAGRPDAWLFELDQSHWDELDFATRQWADSGRPLAAISPTTFVLPSLAGKLDKLRDSLLNGVGFFLLRGFDVARYSLEEAAIAYLGVGSHLGSFRSQNAKGHLLGHVKDLGADINDPGTRYYQTNRGLEFHTDSCDVVGLLCLRGARSGGGSRLVSSVTIYNTMRAQSPELCRALFEPFPTDRRGEVPAGRDPWFELAVMHWHEQRLSTIYAGQYIRSAQALFANAPRITDVQTAAIDRLDELANDPELNLVMDFRPGDMQFIHNHQVLHAREDFIDWPEPSRRRHLLRLWLAPAEGRPLPPCYETRYGDITPGARGGIVTPDTTELTFSIEA